MTTTRHRVYRGRFAPSPTGELHFGSLVAALASALQAQVHQGTWLLRIDDIDPPREVAGAADSILTSLKDHGFETSLATVYQSQRTDRYKHAIERLSRAGLVYGCDCSRKQIAEARNTSGSCPGDCPGNCRQRSLTLDAHSVRFIADGIERFDDGVMGPMNQDLAAEVGDFVVRRRDGLFSYQLASVVDDGEDSITEIVRGADLLDNTPRQLALFRALGYTIPAFMHIPVAVDTSNQKLSKQSQASLMHAADALHNLTAAWAFLGQDSFTDQPGLKACNTPDDFWEQARQLWNPTRIPAVMTQSVNQALC